MDCIRFRFKGQGYIGFDHCSSKTFDKWERKDGTEATPEGPPIELVETKEGDLKATPLLVREYIYFTHCPACHNLGKEYGIKSFIGLVNSAKVVALKKAATFTGITSIEPTVDEPTLGVGLSGDASMCLPSTIYLRKRLSRKNLGYRRR